MGAPRLSTYHERLNLRHSFAIRPAAKDFVEELKLSLQQEGARADRVIEAVDSRRVSATVGPRPDDQMPLGLRSLSSGLEGPQRGALAEVEPAGDMQCRD